MMYISPNYVHTKEGEESRESRVEYVCTAHTYIVHRRYFF